MSSKAYHRAYYLVHKDEQLAIQKERRGALTPEQRAERNRATHERYKAKRNAYMRQWRADNKEHAKALTDAWREANRGRTAANAQAYRARRRGAPGRFTDADIQMIYAEQGGNCPGCTRPLNGIFQRDHVVALVVGGANDASNIQLLCKSCNCVKRDRPLTALLALRG